MKPFRFRLETLLEFRKMKKEQEQVVFLQAVNQLNLEKKILMEMKQKLLENVELLTVRQQQSLSIEIFKSFHYYFDKINKEIIKQNARVLEADEYRQQCLKALVEAERNHKAVEKFREKKVEQYQFEAMNEEQKSLDEIGLQIYTREK
jgi:flagellar protein FliJ